MGVGVGGNSEVSNICPSSPDGAHRIVEIHASREGYWQSCGLCRKGWWAVDLRPVRDELRMMGADPDDPTFWSRP